MLANKLFAVFTFFLLGLVASAPLTTSDPPVGIVKRDDTDVYQVFVTLKVSTDDVLPQLQQLATNGLASDDTVTPLLQKLTFSLNQATSSLSALSPSTSSPNSRSYEALTNLISEIVNEIIATTGGLSQAGISVPALNGLLRAVDTVLNEVLNAVDRLLAGVSIFV
ncbi:hypothetical protein L218DRAFT_866745 [Marasmius fiardii PR-910]|nr:hypothetical protein L218DRAFT_866745 [Marasmius fiardii PR-910]